MERAERETVITANQADIDEGFIRVWTTEPRIVRRLVEKAGAQILRECSAAGRITGTDLRVPWSRVSRGLLAIKSSTARRPIDIERAKAQLAAMRLAQKHKKGVL